MLKQSVWGLQLVQTDEKNVLVYLYRVAASRRVGADSAASDIGHFCRHDGHKLNIAFQR